MCDLTSVFDLPQPTTSHHLKMLHEAGQLERDKRGVWVVYYRARTQPRPASTHLAALMDARRIAPWAHARTRRNSLGASPYVQMHVREHVPLQVAGAPGVGVLGDQPGGRIRTVAPTSALHQLRNPGRIVRIPGVTAYATGAWTIKSADNL